MNLPLHVQEQLDAGALFVINHSGGKDSQAMTALLATVLPPSQVLVVHAELPGVDWEGIPEHIEATTPEKWQIRYCRAVVTFFGMVERRLSRRPDAPCWPSPTLRQCTSDLKRGPIAKLIRHYLREHPEHHGRVVHCIGIRAQESARRAKAKPWKRNERESKAGREVWEWLPIFRMDVHQVFNTIREHGQRPFWTYGAGMTRLSCAFCIMASEQDLKTAARLRPLLAARYVELENRSGYTMSMSRRPLAEIIDQAADISPQQLDLLCFECG